MTKVRLGDHVQCKLTGFQGITTSRHLEISGNIRWGISPPAVDGGPVPDAYLVDDFTVEILAEQVIEPAPEPKMGFQLGDRLEDISTGVQGTATCFNVFIAGCAQYTLRYLDGDGNPQSMGVAESLLKLISPKAVPAPAQDQKTKPPGGPSGRILSSKVCR